MPLPLEYKEAAIEQLEKSQHYQKTVEENIKTINFLIKLNEDLIKKAQEHYNIAYEIANRCSIEGTEILR